MNYNKICKSLLQDYWDGVFYKYSNKYRILDDDYGHYPIYVDNYCCGYIQVLDMDLSSELVLFLFNDSVEKNFKLALAKLCVNQDIIVIYRNNTNKLFEDIYYFTQDDILNTLLHFSKDFDKDCKFALTNCGYFIILNSVGRVPIYNILQSLQHTYENRYIKIYSLFDYNKIYDNLECNLYYWIPMYQKPYAFNSTRLLICKKYYNKICKINDLAKNYIFSIKAKEAFYKQIKNENFIIFVEIKTT